MSHTEGTPESLATLLERLSAAAQRAEADDLAVLAKMHGWSEAVGQAAHDTGPAPCVPVWEAARLLTQQLESLILGDAEDASAMLARVVEGVRALNQLVGAMSPNNCMDIAAAAAAEQTDESAPGAAVFAVSAAPEEEEEPGHVETASATPAEPAAPASEPATPDEPPYVSEPLILNKKEEEFLKAFVEEAREHIESVEASLLEVERDPGNESRIDDLFRPFHTIKGMAGFLNLRDVNCLTYEAETLLDQCRKGKRKVTAGVIDTTFDVVDVLRAQIDSLAAYLAEPIGDTVPQPPVSAMIGKLRQINAFQIEPRGRMPAPAEPGQSLGDALVAQGATSREAIDAALSAQQSTGAGRKVGEILIESGAATARQVDQALRSQAVDAAEAAAAARAGPVGDQSVRIETAKLDALVDMVGELVIAQTQVSANAQIEADPKLTKNVSQVTKIVRDVQEVAMAMRMVPIGPTFQKMARLVRDVSRKAGKQVNLAISGEDTELDKNVIQQIGDPLVHMVRNAVDHGVESPAARRAAGKPEIGVVHLAASHQGGNIAIEISDDGKGLDPAALFRKAVEKGLVEPDADMSDPEIFSLVFAPGFSTAEKVTDISGRGVGMDVVKRNIEQLRGRVDIRSEKGKGSSFTICLPLTLAIIDGMVVRVGTERFIIQTITIEQSLRPVAKNITTVQHRGEVLNNRGRLIPLIQLGQLFGLTDRIDPCSAMVVIAHCEGRSIGLVVEQLIGQQQVVIKTLGERFEKLRGISGAAILGDGRVGLILEMGGLYAAYNDFRIPKRRGGLAVETRGRDLPALGPPDASADPTATGAVRTTRETVLIPA